MIHSVVLSTYIFTASLSALGGTPTWWPFVDLYGSDGQLHLSVFHFDEREKTKKKTKAKAKQWGKVADSKQPLSLWSSGRVGGCLSCPKTVRLQRQKCIFNADADDDASSFCFAVRNCKCNCNRNCSRCCPCWSGRVCRHPAHLAP